MIGTGTSRGHLTSHGQVYIDTWRVGKCLSLFALRTVGQTTQAKMRRYPKGEVC